jgi:hypothetical protein
MRTKLGVIAGIGFLVAAAAMPLLAHHSFAAEFDAKSPVKVEGTVTRMQWTNPHSWVYIDTRKPDGTVENWAVEVGSPTVLFRRGFTRNSLPPGTKVVVEGYRAKDGSRRANGRDITLVDGKKLFVGSTGTGAPYELTPGSQTTK